MAWACDARCSSRAEMFPARGGLCSLYFCLILCLLSPEAITMGWRGSSSAVSRVCWSMALAAVSAAEPFFFFLKETADYILAT